MQTVEEKFIYPTNLFEFVRVLSRKEGFSAKEVGKKMDGREGVVENGGTRFPRVEIFILRKLVEWKSFPFDVLMDYHL